MSGIPVSPESIFRLAVRELAGVAAQGQPALPHPPPRRRNRP